MGEPADATWGPELERQEEDLRSFAAAKERVQERRRRADEEAERRREAERAAAREALADQGLHPLLDAFIDVRAVEWSVRTANVLSAAELTTRRDLVLKTDADLLRTKNFGRKALNEVKGFLAPDDLHLGMTEQDLVDWLERHPA